MNSWNFVTCNTALSFVFSVLFNEVVGIVGGNSKSPVKVSGGAVVFSASFGRSEGKC